ncbi:ribonuclease 1-like isoform X2 [Wolffia australiana]
MGSASHSGVAPRHIRLPSAISQLIALLLIAPGHCYDFLYFVQQWPGSLCNTRESCCYPTSGKPGAEFSIHGLWPSNVDGSYPSFCNPGEPFEIVKISDLQEQMASEWPSLACPSSNGHKFWEHEWLKHGTCSDISDQHHYFQATLNFKRKANLLGALRDAGIVPDGGFYSLSNISETIRRGLGHYVGIVCNEDEAGNTQLYQVYVCLDNKAADFIDCPAVPFNR